MCRLHSCNLRGLAIDLHLATEQTAAAEATIFVISLYLNAGECIGESEDE